MKKIHTWIFIGIIAIAALLRLFQLGSIPLSLNWDEVAFGYNAYSISVDGKDEFGSFLPLQYLESYGDFKPPLYAYLAVLPVMLFGLTEFATRLPSALLGTFMVAATYYLTKEIFYNSVRKERYALFAACILAISPWHINLSRGAFEANVSTSLIVLGVWLFLLGIRKNAWYLILSTLSFCLTFYTFNTPRVVIPFLGIILLGTFFRELLKSRFQSLVSFGLAILLLLPLVPFLLSPQAKLRFDEVNIFSDVSLVERSNQQIENNNQAIWSKLLHNRRVVYAQEYAKHYFDNFNPLFLFVSGDANQRFSTQDVGQMYFWELPFFIAGLLFLFRRREGYWWLIPVWLLVGIIPAATARETPHALRIESSLPMFQLLTAYGLVQLMAILHRNTKGYLYKVSMLGLCLVIFISFTSYIHGYYTHYPKASASSWQYGYKDAVQYVTENYEKYERIVMTEKMGRPYMYFLFYRKTHPAEFRRTQQVERDQFGFVHVNGFDKFVFSDATITSSEKTLFITFPSDMPVGATKLHEFILPDGSVQLVAFTFS